MAQTTVPSSLIPRERLTLFCLIDAKRYASPLVCATIRHAWQTLWRHLTQFELQAKPFYLDRCYYETLQALESAARRVAQSFMHAKLKHRYAHPEPDTDAPEAPGLPSAATKLLTVQWLQGEDNVPRVELTPAFAAALDAARQAAAAAQPTMMHS